MRHRNQHRKLGRTSAHRKALFRNQLTALFTHDRIVTTLAKAKELRPLAERMVTLARTGSLPARRKVITMVPDKDVVRRLFDDIAPRFMDRPGGYTRIMRVGRRRGDGAELAIIEFVDYELAEHEEGDSSSAGKTSLMDRAKGMFGGGAKDADDATDTSGEETAMAEPGEELAEADPSDEPVAEAGVDEAVPVEDSVDEPAAVEDPVEEPEKIEAEPAETEPTEEAAPSDQPEANEIAVDEEKKDA